MNRSAMVRLSFLMVAAMEFGAARTEAAIPGFGTITPAMATSIRLPVEWDGIWATEDSTYDCAGVFFDTGTGFDTLCAGQGFSSRQIVLTCVGSADANTIVVDCAGTIEVIPGCEQTFTLQGTITRSGATYIAQSIAHFGSPGQGAGCDLLTASCARGVSRGVRVGPAPAAYCVTPVKRTTWGSVKAMYR
jgi:hypothetical protein